MITISLPSPLMRCMISFGNVFLVKCIADQRTTLGGSRLSLHNVGSQIRGQTCFIQLLNKKFLCGQELGLTCSQ